MKGVCITVIAAETLYTFRLKSGDRAGVSQFGGIGFRGDAGKIRE
jgi:hypothetical protein